MLLGLVWTAPELLRLNRIPIKGSQDGDVYSFAIIMQELICRYRPYHNNIGYSENSYKGKSSPLLPLMFVIYAICNFIL